MKFLKDTVLILAVTVLFINTFVHSVPVFDNGNAEEVYDPQSLDDIMSLLQPQPSKRGWCRNGFSYSPVLRRCQPSISMLRAGRVGRRRGF